MISKTEARSLSFLLRADEFYTLTRFCYNTGMHFSTFRMAHHAVEYYFKACLAHWLSMKEIKALGHSLQSLWVEYQRHIFGIRLDDRVINHIDSFETLRYPGRSKFVGTIWGLPYEELFNEIMPKVPERSRKTLVCISLQDIDCIIHEIRSSLPNGNKLPILCIGKDQELYLFDENKYFSKEDNEGKFAGGTGS